MAYWFLGTVLDDWFLIHPDEADSTALRRLLQAHLDESYLLSALYIGEEKRNTPPYSHSEREFHSYAKEKTSC